jgi:hypothetical protein
MTDVSFYPPAPLPGSNAIGAFQIGVSPIGTIPAFNWLRTVISQYANSATLLQLIESFDECVDQTANIDAFFDLIWNVDTAQGYGLDVWGRIVGVTRTLQVASAIYLGFASQSPTVGAYNEGILYSGTPATGNYQLTDSAFRTLILAKALANICDGSTPSINQLMLNLFPGRGDCYVTDNHNMTMTYTFKFALTPVEISIVEQSGVLPKTVGVAALFVIAP